MAIIQIFRAQDCPEVPWKNGGGMTREIAVYPPDAGMDDFLWRLSMARMDRPGAFSPFPDIDRTLAVLEGCLHLQGDGVDVRLDEESPPYPFDGGLEPSGAPLGGSVLNLNAMARRTRCTAQMIRHAPSAVIASSGTTILVMLERQELDGIPMSPFDSVLIAGETVLQGRAIQIDFIGD